MRRAGLGGTRKRPGLNYPGVANFNQVLCSGHPADFRPFAQLYSTFLKLNDPYQRTLH
jgi:hypothetical protein